MNNDRSIRRRRIALHGRVELDVAEWGPAGGLPVLMLHGLSDAWVSFEPMHPHLPDTLRVIAPSQRGHGDSGRPADGYGAADLAGDAAALIDALDTGPVVVVGHSMGSVAALRLAIDHPSRVRGVIALGASAHFGANAAVRALYDEDVAHLRDPIDRAFVHAFQASTAASPLPPALLERMVDQSMKVPAHVWRTALRALIDEDLGDALRGVHVPVALLRGAQDAIAGADDQARLCALLPRAVATTWPGIGHSPNWEDPARCARYIADTVGRMLARPLDHRREDAMASSPA